ncbi:MAG: hypothetical protein ACKOU7_02380 [Ferruginibacter sp.]
MKQIKTIIAIAIFSMLSFTSVFANKTPDSASSLPVELNYMGVVKNQPLFQLNFSGSEEESEFNITIVDENGYVFYNENVKGGKFTKQFLFNAEDLSASKIHFEITGKKSGKTVVYNINRKTKVIEEINITKL